MRQFAAQGSLRWIGSDDWPMESIALISNDIPFSNYRRKGSMNSMTHDRFFSTMVWLGHFLLALCVYCRWCGRVGVGIFGLPDVGWPKSIVSTTFFPFALHVFPWFIAALERLSLQWMRGKNPLVIFQFLPILSLSLPVVTGLALEREWGKNSLSPGNLFLLSWFGLVIPCSSRLGGNVCFLRVCWAKHTVWICPLTDDHSFLVHLCNLVCLFIGAQARVAFHARDGNIALSMRFRPLYFTLCTYSLLLAWTSCLLRGCGARFPQFMHPILIVPGVCMPDVNRAWNISSEKCHFFLAVTFESLNSQQTISPFFRGLILGLLGPSDQCLTDLSS